MSEWVGCFCLQCIREKEVGVVEDLGQFKRLVGEGPSCIIWPLQSVVGRLSLRVQQLDVLCETKTKDNVFVQVGVAVQYKVVTESAYDAWYRLTSPTSQIQAYVFDVIRSTVPRMELDQAFESKDDIAQAVLEQLQNVMKDYGYKIVNTLVTDLAPDSKVKASMNEINAARRLKEVQNFLASLSPGSIYTGIGPVMITPDMPAYKEINAVKIDLGAITDEVHTVNPGQQITVTTAENPTTGYTWQQQVGGDVASAIHMTKSSYEAAAPGMIGGGGVRTFTFDVDNAVGMNGKDFSLEFVDARPWEMNSDGPFEASNVIQFTIA